MKFLLWFSSLSYLLYQVLAAPMASEQSMILNLALGLFLHSVIISLKFGFMNHSEI